MSNGSDGHFLPNLVDVVEHTILLHSELPNRFKVFPRRLQSNYYFLGVSRGYWFVRQLLIDTIKYQSMVGGW
jgi:hypothetical protein